MAFCFSLMFRSLDCPTLVLVQNKTSFLSLLILGTLAAFLSCKAASPLLDCTGQAVGTSCQSKGGRGVCLQNICFVILSQEVHLKIVVKYTAENR